MDSQNNLNENQDLKQSLETGIIEKKYPIGGYAPGHYYCTCCVCGNRFMGDKRAVECESCATKEQSDKPSGHLSIRTSLEEFKEALQELEEREGLAPINQNDVQVGYIPDVITEGHEQQMKKAEEIFTVEKPVFIACKEPVLINKLNDFLRTFGNDNEIYKLLVISPDISEKLFETYWFSKLNDQEQEILRTHKQNEEWKSQAFQTAKQIEQCLIKNGIDFDFKIMDLKKALRNDKIVLTATQMKQMIDVLLVFGYVQKINDSVAFGKMKFQLTLDNEYRLNCIREQISSIKHEIEQKNVQIMELQFRERELMGEQINQTIQQDDTKQKAAESGQY